MKGISEIDVKELVKAVEDFNKLEIMEPIKIPKKLNRKSLEKLRDDFVEACESLTEEEEELLPDNVVDMYNFIVEDEVEEEEGIEEGKVGRESADAPPVKRVEVGTVACETYSEKTEEEGKAKKSRAKRGLKEKISFLESLISEGRYTVDEVVERYVERFGGSPVTPKTYIYCGKSSKYNKFSKLITIENGIVKFVEE